VFIDFEGVLAEPRPTTAELGKPLDGAIDFLHDTLKSGCRVKIATSRDVRMVRHWLQIHSAPFDIEIIHADDADIHLSTRALRFAGTFPSMQELQDFTPWQTTH
jgi:hypothetical protein